MYVRHDNLKESYDLIIIGSGPAGITLARKFEKLNGPNKSVLIIESGKQLQGESEAQKLAAVEASGDLSSDYYPVHNQRVLGGTSTIWNGYCAVMEKRSFDNNEWPMSYSELYKYYPEASSILELPDAVHTRPEKVFSDNQNIVYKPYYLSPPTRFNDSSFKEWLNNSTTIDILFNHTVMEVSIKNNVATSVIMRESTNIEMPSIEIYGGKIILATGGVQNARLLKLSLPEHSNLPVGSYFCEHPHIYGAASITLDKEKFYQIRDNKIEKMVHAIALSSEFSNKHDLKSVTFEIPSSAILEKNILGKSRGSVTVKANIRAEMSSVVSNKISLSNMKKDFMGYGIANIHLKFDPQEVLAASEVLAAELVRSGIGRMSVMPSKFGVTGGGHMMGTTRMGKDEKTSVTNANGKVHGVANLYVAGSSLFSSSAASNPTLTIVALSLRLAYYLTKENQNESS
jgi:choline dehydrogenase-like flavoprotein